MKKIEHIHAREILDSRGNPTIEVDLMLADKSFGRASVPSGASTGSHEAVEMRDNETRYNGKGVRKAVGKIIAELSPHLLGQEFDQESLDAKMKTLDGTADKSRLGANSILGVSLAFAHAFAKSDAIPLYSYFSGIAATGKKLELPVPMINILNGGKHARNSTDIQEFMIVPIGAPTFTEALRYGTETFHALGKILEQLNLSTTVGDEGGYAPSLQSNESALELIVGAIEKAGYVPGKDIALAIDAAASEFFTDGLYEFKKEARALSTDEMINFWKGWALKYPLVSLEDALSEDDWSGYTTLTRELGTTVQIVGDDLFATNPDRLRTGISQKAANAILVKPNQIGTVTETIEAVTIAQEAGYATIISHRSGETEDTTIADLAVGLGCGQIKTGSVSRSERVGKYNRLLRIEEELGSRALFRGRNV